MTLQPGTKLGPYGILAPLGAGGHPQVSPDGRFVAGVSGSATNFSVFVQSLTGPPGRWQVSNSLGGKPRWTRGGRERVCESDSRMVAVDIDTRIGFRAGVPRELFGPPSRSPGRDVFGWGVDADGERFVVLAPPAGSTGRRTLQVFTRFDALVKRD